MRIEQYWYKRVTRVKAMDELKEDTLMIHRELQKFLKQILQIPPFSLNLAQVWVYMWGCCYDPSPSLSLKVLNVHECMKETASTRIYYSKLLILKLDKKVKCLCQPLNNISVLTMADEIDLETRSNSLHSVYRQENFGCTFASLL